MAWFRTRGEEQVEEDGSQHTPLLDAVADAEGLCCFTV